MKPTQPAKAKRVESGVVESGHAIGFVIGLVSLTPRRDTA
jgi:hypothetical protein